MSSVVRISGLDSAVSRPRARASAWGRVPPTQGWFDGDRAAFRLMIWPSDLTGAILIPKDGLLCHRSVEGRTSSYKWPERTLGTISSDFKVSKEVILRRLLIAGLTSKEFYLTKRIEWMKKEKKPKSPKGKGIKRDIPKECLQRNGEPLTSLVLDSYRNDRITTSDVADYLGIRVKHIPRIERLLEA
jgi:hypothetical protein